MDISKINVIEFRLIEISFTFYFIFSLWTVLANSIGG